jgi:hypothetical protein
LNSSIEPGERLANIVWFANANDVELKTILTDSAGVSHTYSLGIGKIDSNIMERQKKVAADTLPPQFLEIWQNSKSPFIQRLLIA